MKTESTARLAWEHTHRELLPALLALKSFREHGHRPLLEHVSTIGAAPYSRDVLFLPFYYDDHVRDRYLTRRDTRGACPREPRLRADALPLWARVPSCLTAPSPVKRCCTARGGRASSSSCSNTGSRRSASASSVTRASTSIIGRSCSSIALTSRAATSSIETSPGCSSVQLQHGVHLRQAARPARVEEVRAHRRVHRGLPARRATPSRQ